MSRDFVTKALEGGIRQVLDQIRKEGQKTLVREVQVEEGLRLDRQKAERLQLERRAYEGSTVWHRSNPDADEQRLFCKRVWHTYFLVTKDGSEPYKLARNPEEIVRNGVERDLDIMDEKIRNLQVSSVSAFTRTLDNTAKMLRKELERVQKLVDNMYRFRGRVYDRACRNGLILKQNRRQG